MFCPQCNRARLRDDVPCLNCGAPSPHTLSMQSFKRGVTEEVRQVPGLPHTAPLQTWQQFSPASDFDAADVYTPRTDSLRTEHQPTLSLQLVPEHALAELLPEQTGRHAFVAIAPMYTRPRPLTPPHRIIGGLVSVLIVCALLCSGSIYYAQASGLVEKFNRIYFNTPPKNIPPTVWAQLPEPPEQTEQDRNGPAITIIPSATTTDRYDPKTYMALSPQTKFTTRQTIYLTFSVQTPKQDGRVVAKWYTNNKYFLTQTSSMLKVKDIPSNAVKNGFFTMRYILPAEGKVELYWNNQWAQTLHFVVNA